MNRKELINDLIRRKGYKSYLEIGVFNGWCFNEIVVERKVGVDPNPQCPGIIRTTSDEFFTVSKDSWDIIFVDGLHLEKQVMRDILNSLSQLNDGGIIVVHDCDPPKEEHQREEMVVPYWSGTVWKGWVKLRMLLSHKLEMFVITADTGLGIIYPSGKNIEPFNENLLDSDLTFERLDKNREKWLNLKGREETKRWLNAL